MNSSLNYKYIILYILIAILPFKSYFIKSSVPLTSYDPQLTYSYYLYNYNMFHSKGIPHINNLYGMGTDTASIDPAFNAFRLPNLIAYIFPDPMQGWIFLLVLQYFFMGLCSLRYFRYLKLQDNIAFLCSIIYMLTPLNDEFIYQNFWGFIYLFAPVLLIILHKINDRKYDIFNGALWLSLIFALTYLSAGAIGVMYLGFGSLIYIIFVFISWQNILHSLPKYLYSYVLAAFLSIGMSSYILIPFLLEAWFMDRATVPRETYISFSQYFIYLLQNCLSLIIPIRLDCTLSNINLVGRTELITFFNNTWVYINIALLPALIYVLRYKSTYRRFAYLFIFLFFAVLTPPYVINFNTISVNLLKCYPLQKLFMFSSLVGCVSIGCFFQDQLKNNNKIQSIIRKMTIFYASLIALFIIILSIYYFTGFTASKLFLMINELTHLWHSNKIHRLFLEIIQNPFIFSLIFHNFQDKCWLIFLYYVSITGMLAMILYKDILVPIMNELWLWVYILLIVLNVSLLYSYSYPLVNKDILNYYHIFPKYMMGNNIIHQGDRVAFYVNLDVNKLDNTIKRYRTNPLEEINETAEKLKMMDRMTMKDLEIYSQSHESSPTMYIRTYQRTTPYIHSGISQFTVFLHFLYPGFRNYYFNLNKKSHDFINLVKTREDIYEYPYLYDHFDPKEAGRLGIRMVIANAPINGEKMSFIRKTKRGLYIYEIKGAYPNIKLNFANMGENANREVKYSIDKYYESKGRKSIIKMTISELKGEKVLKTTIPFNRHWTIWGDGTPLKIYKDMNLFISARIPSGTKTIALKYYNQNFKIGVILSFIFWFIWLGLYCIKRYKIIGIK